MAEKMLKALIAIACLFTFKSAMAQPYQGSMNVQDVRIINNSTATYAIVGIITDSSTIPSGGISTQVLYNNGGYVAGSASMTFNGSSLTVRALVVGTTAYVTPVINNLGSIGGTFTVDWNVSKSQYLNLTANSTATFRNGVSGERYTLIIKQGGAGSFLITWPGTVRFSGAVTPVLTTTAGKVDYFGFIYNDIDSKYDNVAFAQNY